MKRIIITESQYDAIVGNSGKGGTVVYLMLGIPGSGKSTWCQQNHPDLPVVSRDLIRAELGYTSGADEKAVLPREAEEQVTSVEYDKMGRYLSQGQSFIVDDTNANAFYRQKMVDFLKKGGARIVGVHVDTPLDVCTKRREGQIPPEIIKRMHDRLAPFGDGEVDDVITVR